MEVTGNEPQIVSAGEKNKAAGLPPLEGSEKQIDWAEKLRRSAYLSAQTWLEHRLGLLDATHADVRQKAMAEQVVKDFLATVKASWWIDQRLFPFTTIEKLDKQFRLARQKSDTEAK